MSARADQVFNYHNLTVGHTYKRTEALPEAGVEPPRNFQEIGGVTRFKNCVVLFVTLDKTIKEENHKYKDEFLLHGKSFQWESQNKNTRFTSHIQMMLNGEPVVLFARVHEKIKSKTQPFVYVGGLTCIQHFFRPDEPKSRIELIFNVDEYKPDASAELQALYEWTPGDDAEPEEETFDTSVSKLVETAPPKRRQSANINQGTNTGNKSSSKGEVDWAARDEANRNLGLAGEELVITYEKEELERQGKHKLAAKIKHVALEDPKAGYDILSFDADGNEKYIEVKTTRGSASNAFYISRNELEVSKTRGDNYWIYRVHSYAKKTDTWKVYKLQGAVSESFDLTPESFTAKIKS